MRQTPRDAPARPSAPAIFHLALGRGARGRARGLRGRAGTRERAIAYLIDSAALTPDFATAEVGRYIVMRGQAAAYKIGELRIKALHARAQAELGDAFDLRRFHNALIDHGAVPLDVLDLQIADWIAAEKARTH